MSRLLLTYLRPLWWRVLLLSAALLGGIGLALINPQIIRRFIDMAVAGGARQGLLRMAALFLVLALLHQVVRTATSYLSEDVGWRATNQLRSDLTAHCLELDMSFHQRHTPGTLIERVDGDVSMLAEYFSRLVIELIGNLLLVVGVTALLFREWWAFGLVSVAYLLLFAGFFRFLRPYAVRLNRDIRQVSAELSGFMEEVLVSKEDVRGVAAEPYIFLRLYCYMRRRLRLALRENVIAGSAFNVSALLFVLSSATVIYLGAMRFRQGAMSIGTVFLAVYYVGLLERPMNLIRRQTNGLYHAAAGIGRISEFLDEESAVASRPSRHKVSVPGGQERGKAPSLHFDGVSFAYGEGTPTVQEITFRLEAEQVMGLLGRTGSGKTTLTRLLFRLYDPQRGGIFLDGVDLRDIPLPDLRRRVSMVTQEVQLFAGSVRDNLTFFSPNYDDRAVMEALEQLGLRPWVESLPQGLQTPLGSGGQGLSAGQAQLLAFARACLRDPDLLVLDEASSRLDPLTEALMEQAVSRLLAGRTAIIIAHRLATVQRADQILILEGGRIKESGPRTELAQDSDSHFAHLLRTGLVAEGLAEREG